MTGSWVVRMEFHGIRRLGLGLLMKSFYEDTLFGVDDAE